MLQMGYFCLKEKENFIRNKHAWDKHGLPMATTTTLMFHL